jgi:hypothetical protein
MFIPDVHETQGEAPARTTSHEPLVVCNRSELLRKEVLTKQEAYWLANVARATWDRYAAAKEAGHTDFQNFPTTYKPNGKRTGRSYYKTSEVADWINSWPAR